VDQESKRNNIFTLGNGVIDYSGKEQNPSGMFQLPKWQ